jgi:PilZ domain
LKQGRRHQRFIRRLETEFSADGRSYIGISSDFSFNGLFVRTNHSFVPGTIVDLTVHLPDGKESRLKGSVRRAMKTPIAAMKNGMGIELIEKDRNYADFITSFSDSSGNDPGVSARASGSFTSQEMKGPDAAAEFLILQCPRCGIRNKVKRTKLSLGPRCGKCGAPMGAS